jgi:hypothetical protein
MERSKKSPKQNRFFLERGRRDNNANESTKRSPPFHCAIEFAVQTIFKKKNTKIIQKKNVISFF